MTVLLRVLDQLREQGITNQQIARVIGVDNSYLSHMAHGRKRVSYSVVQRLLKNYEIEKEQARELLRSVRVYAVTDQTAANISEILARAI